MVVGTGLYFSLANVSKLSFVSLGENFRAEFLPHSISLHVAGVFFFERSSSMVSFLNASGKSLFDSNTCKFRFRLSHTNNLEFSSASWDYLTLILLVWNYRDPYKQVCSSWNSV